jgi:hypothetical protein
MKNSLELKCPLAHDALISANALDHQGREPHSLLLEGKAKSIFFGLENLLPINSETREHG